MIKRVPNKCIYCQGTGVSKEHYWNRWSKKYATTSAPQLLHFTQLGMATSLNVKDGRPINHSIRKVCKKCNNGWLRLVGERAEPVIANLIKNKTTYLTPDEKLSLSMWITTFSMTWEFRDIKTKATPQWERQYVAENQMPPPTWHIWLSIGDGSWDSGVKHAMIVARMRSKKTANSTLSPLGLGIEKSQVTTFGLNILQFHAFSTRAPVNPNLNESFSDFGPSCIWPIQDSTTINWASPMNVIRTDDLHFRTFNLAFPGFDFSKTYWARY